MTRFVLKAAGGTFLLRVFYLGSGFLTTLLLTKWLGAEGLGVYNFVISWVVLTVIFTKFGFEDFLVRETAARKTTNDLSAANALLGFTMKFVLTTSFIFATLIAAIVAIYPFENTQLRPAFIVGLPLVLFLATLAMYRGRFRAMKYVIFSQLPEHLIRPLIVILGISACLLFGIAGLPQTALGLNVLATGFAIGFCWWVNQRLFDNRNPHKVTASEAKKWIAGAAPFVLIASMQIVNQRTDRIMLGGLVDMESVGVYSVAIQMALVVNTTLISINHAVGPLIAERFRKGKQNELQQALVRTTLLATVGSIGIVICLATLGPYVLSLFEKEFGASYVPMLILAVGQLINVAAGPAGVVLAMSNNERMVGLGVFVSAVTNVILNIILIPLFQETGAAVATAISMATWNLLLIYFVKRNLGLHSSALALLLVGAVHQKANDE